MAKLHRRGGHPPYRDCTDDEIAILAKIEALDPDVKQRIGQALEQNPPILGTDYFVVQASLLDLLRRAVPNAERLIAEAAGESPSYLLHHVIAELLTAMGMVTGGWSKTLRSLGASKQALERQRNCATVKSQRHQARLDIIAKAVVEKRSDEEILALLRGEHSGLIKVRGREVKENLLLREIGSARAAQRDCNNSSIPER
jgi:hypothetical protein